MNRLLTHGPSILAAAVACLGCGSESDDADSGGGYILMIPADFQSRLTWTVFRGPTGEAETPIAVATDGNTMAVAMQQSETDGAIPALITVNAVQSTPGGGASDGWVAVWQAP